MDSGVRRNDGSDGSFLSIEAIMTTETAIRHFDAVMDGGFAGKPVIGLITLSTDTITEHELRLMAPADRIVVSSTRIKTTNPLTVESLRAHVGEISHAVRLFDPIESVSVFAYSCTSGSSVNPLSALQQGVRDGGSDAPITAPTPAALAAFRALGVSRIAMLTPYPDEVTLFMRDVLAKNGVEAVSLGSFHFDIDYLMAGISPGGMVEAATALDDPRAEAIFLPCTGLRASSAIPALEARLGKPVVTAHQAMLWHALQLSGHPMRLEGVGRLFQL
jgi:maleate isomerase